MRARKRRAIKRGRGGARRPSGGRLEGIHHRGLTRLRRGKESPFRVAGFGRARRSLRIGSLCRTRRTRLLGSRRRPGMRNVSRRRTGRTLGGSCRREEDVVSTDPVRMTVTKHVVFGEIVKGTSFYGVRSLRKGVRMCMTESTVKASTCTSFGGSSVNSVFKLRKFTFEAEAKRVSVRTRGVALLSGDLRVLPRGFRNLASASAHCHRECMSLVVGTSSGSAFVGHSGVLTTVHGCLDKRKFVRIRAPVLMTGTNKTTTEPFRARFGTLGRSLGLHVSLRLCLGELVIKKLRGMCRVKHMFHGRNLSAERGPRFALVRLCRTCASCRNVVSLARGVCHFITRRILKAARVICGKVPVSLNGPFRHVAVISTIGGCTNIS